MGLLSRLFGSKQSAAGGKTARATTADDPFRIERPTIGFLNLRGSAGEPQMQADQQVLRPLFTEVRVSTKEVPQCALLFLYCELDQRGRLVGHDASLRDIIRDAHAYVAVVATENPPNNYLSSLGPRQADWSANIVLTIDRKGDKFAPFFAALFRRMFAGTSMLTAWAELAPQIPGHDHPDAPGTMMVAEAGHVVLGR